MAEKKEKTFEAEENIDTVQEEQVAEDIKQEDAGKQETKTESISLKELEEKMAATNEKYLRLSAEFDNYRKRTIKEKAELIKNAGEEVLNKILPVVDNFERALASIEQSDDVAALRQGVELIYNSFKDFLTQNGVKEIACVNTDFNTDEQEAVTKIPAPTPELKGKVVDCIQKGYTLNGKVMRFAKVVVGE
ncbi:nucleotide exchange factor GrpE [Odoribacter lunatus]|uniref:nucleotide exchange factor GrpE n=1 Tax=Odoribacter lunatus TaxID=2941335 RepID=UPI00203A99C5|nr:nucleotide exchange factor GrpE [Odoribacter lunatus]